ncbi:P-loop containing nucleoside triphosphate hydrolase protein [Aspergillus avenaceus]|uniref:P-loop containing nucleoside triphosphate hydrolase protein n=1 Tax=Aspergillus avenaceus TaxID=36643 RepID=A0A5N6U9J0_ASPAV|nr:P-loop containing nucleoside triphosphate hydrolase protein [Aspergillus avenaceus]
MSDEEILLCEIAPVAGSLRALETIECQICRAPSDANFVSIYRYAKASRICALLGSVFCAVVAGAAMPLVTIVFGALAGEFINGEEKDAHDVRNRVQHLTLVLVYIAIGSFVTTVLSTWGFNVVGEQITRHLQQCYLSSVLQQNMAYFDVVGTGELTSRLDQDMKSIQAGISHKLGTIISGISGFLVAIICAFTQNARFASIMIAQPIAKILLVGLKGACHSAKLEHLAQEVLSAMRNVIAYRSQGRYARKYRDALIRPTALDFQERLIFGGIVAGSFTILHWANGLGLWQAGRLFHQGHCTVPEALSVLYATAVAGGMLCQALPHVVDVTRASAAANRVYEVIERVSPIDPFAESEKMYDPVRGEVLFDAVNFAYPSRPERAVLKDVSFGVPAGHTVALVGPSGSGKSTIFVLLERMYLPISGSIMLDNEQIEELNVSWLRSQIGYVPQDISLFSGSIHENIACGLPHATSKVNAATIRDLLVQAAKTAHIHTFITTLSDGYETVIGANGATCSGGQKQRIAIARATVSQPTILLLDEATASLDSQCEKDVQDALKKAASGRTTLIIAHRLSTVQHADTIIVMKDGQIIDRGSHTDLMSTSAMYRELVEQQALLPGNHFREPPHLTQSPNHESKGVQRGMNDTNTPSVTMATSPRNSIGHVWHLNKLELPFVCAGVILSALAGVTYPVQACFFGNGMISIVNPTLSTGRHDVHFWARAYLVHGIVVFAIYCVRGYCFAVSASKLLLRARSQLFQTLLLKPLSFFEHKNHSTGSLVSFLSSGIPKITGISGTSLGLVVESIVMLGTGITVGCIFGWKLGVVAIATVPFIAMSSFLQYYIEVRSQKHIKRETDAVTVAHEAFAAIKTVTALSLQSRVLESLRKENQRDTRTGYWITSAAIHGCTISLRILCIAFVFWYGGTHLIATGEYTIRQFLICFAATVWGKQSAATLFAHAPDIAGARAAAERLKEIMVNDSRGNFSDKDQGFIPAPSTTEDLTLEHVNFRYPTYPKELTLKDITFTAPAGRFIVLVGATGSGKSSVINLIERFYAPESGRIILGHCPIEKYTLNSYREYIALVDQNPCLLGETLHECLLSDETDIPDEEMWRVLEDIGLAGFVQSLLHGLNTPVMSNGSTLSGGQRQRLAIAKAVLCRPRILLLDEATSALDTATEIIVQQAVKRAMKGRTVISVAHRLKTVIDADEILVFDNGSIVERGTHGQLMRLRERYWGLARLQALGFE